MRKLLAMSALLAGLVAVLPAHATSWCPSSQGGGTDVIILSGTGLLVNDGTVGCLATDGSEDPTYNTDYINPGTTLIVRWLGEGDELNPPPGTAVLKASPGLIIGCRSGHLTENPCQINWEWNADQSIWDSQAIGVNRTKTTEAGVTATAEITGACFDPPDCTVTAQSHAYRTLTT